MSEQQQYIGDRWTKESIKILTSLGWEQINDSGYDIPCSFKSKHGKNSDKERKNDHGIDSSFICYDPFFNKRDIVIVESKTRKWKGLSTSQLKEMITQLLFTLQCSSCSNAFNGYTFDTCETGLLMIWCNEPNEYDYKEFIERLNQVKLPNHTKFSKLYVASNYDILKYCSLIKTVNEINSNPNCTEFNFFYPAEHFGKYHNVSSRHSSLNLSYMFSKIIFAKSKENINIQDITIPIDINHIFFYGEPELSELFFINTLIEKYQLEDASKIIFHFYGKQDKFRNDLTTYQRKMNQKYQDNNKKLKIEYHYMQIFAEVPIDLRRA